MIALWEETSRTLDRLMARPADQLLPQPSPSAGGARPAVAGPLTNHLLDPHGATRLLLAAQVRAPWGLTGRGGGREGAHKARHQRHCSACTCRTPRVGRGHGRDGRGTLRMNVPNDPVE